MAINLEKSQSIDLTKSTVGLNNLGLGLGWDASDASGNNIDCDVFCLYVGFK